MDRLHHLLRFAIVGVAVALTYVCLYLTLIAAGVPRFMANGLAFFQAIILQYAAQAAFTFKRQLADQTQIVRFAAMVSLGFISSALITGPIADMTGLADWKAAFAVTVLLPFQNYILLSLWVFAAPASSRSEPSA
jgi:putative flippase GtrA